MFLTLDVAPHKRTFLRRLICDLIDNIITEVEVVGIIKCYFFKPAVFIESLITKLFVYTHSYSLMTASAPNLRNLS